MTKGHAFGAQKLRRAETMSQWSLSANILSEFKKAARKRLTVARNLLDGGCISRNIRRHQAIVMSVARNQFLSPGGVVRACEILLGLLLPATVATICPPFAEAVLADEPTTAQEQAPAESPQPEQSQQQERGSSPT